MTDTRPDGLAVNYSADQLADFAKGRIADASAFDRQLHLDLGTAPQPRWPSKREERWRRDVWSDYAKLMQFARSPEEEAEFTRLVEEELARGPDYKRVRRGSQHREAPEHYLDRNDLAKLRFKLKAVKQRAFAAGDSIPKGLADVLEALILLALKYRRVFPRLEKIAALALVRAKDTVLACLRVLAHYGLVTIIRRRKMVETPLGFRTRQDSNAYVLHPEADLTPVMKRAENPADFSESMKSSAKSYPHLSKTHSSLDASSGGASGRARATPASSSTSGKPVKGVAKEPSSALEVAIKRLLALRTT